MMPAESPDFIDPIPRLLVVRTLTAISVIASLNLLITVSSLDLASFRGWTLATADYLAWSFHFTAVATVLYLAGLLGWLYRVYRNLPVITGAAASWHSLWVFAMWVVPLVNLVLPYLIMREIWHKSVPSQIRQKTPVIFIWWLCHFFGQSLLTNHWQTLSTVGSPAFGPRLPEFVFANAMFSLAALLACWVARRVSEQQCRRHDLPPEPPQIVSQPNISQTNYF